MRDPVYLDHNATTTIRPAAADAVYDALTLTGNPSSVHSHGRMARRVMEDARDNIGNLVGANPNDVLFTGCGTESNNLALCGTLAENFFVSTTEHPSTLMANDKAQAIAVDTEGLIDINALDALLSAASGRSLISVMLANNETGVIQPISEVVRIAKQYDALVHCDAIQGAGKIPVDMTSLGLDLMSLSAHKIGGPQGVGALIARAGLDMVPVLRGGGQERRMRAGTENVAGIAGFGAAAREASSGLDHMDSLRILRDQVVSSIRSYTPVRVFGEANIRLPNTACIAMPGVSAETQLMAFDLSGVSVSSGSACSSGKVESSHVLAAMGVDADEALTAIRISLGWNNTPKDADKFIDVWTTIFSKFQAQSAQAMAG
jgi:cysteine desulfurase